MDDETLLTQIYDALYEIGFKANHSGFFYLSHAVFLCVRESDRWTSEMELWSAVAQHYHTTPQTVKTQLHAALTTAWRIHKVQMKNKIGDRLDRQPSDTKILAYLYRYITGPGHAKRE